MLALWTGRPWAATTPISLYPLYTAASAVGWGLGNLFVARTRGEGRAVRRVLMPLYLIAPSGLLFALWSTARIELQIGVPMAPVYACGIYGVLFLVPVTFARGRG